MSRFFFIAVQVYRIGNNCIGLLLVSGPGVRSKKERGSRLCPGRETLLLLRPRVKRNKLLVIDH